MLGDIMKELRLTNKYTQEDLAKKLKISKSTIGMYEQNRRTPDLETLVEFADIFNVTIDYLLGHANLNTASSKSISWKEVQHAFPNAVLLNTEKKDIIDYYELLSITDKRWIMGQMIDLIKKYETAISDIQPKIAQ